MNRPTDEIDSRIDMERVLSALPPQQRRAVRLYARGYTQKEVADALGVHRNTICNWMKQFRRFYREFCD